MPRRQVLDQLDHAQVAIEKYDINREAHERRVDRRGGLQQHALTGWQRAPTEQAPHPSPGAVRDQRLLADDVSSGEVDDQLGLARHVVSVSAEMRALTTPGSLGLRAAYKGQKPDRARVAVGGRRCAGRNSPRAPDERRLAVPARTLLVTTPAPRSQHRPSWSGAPRGCPAWQAGAAWSSRRSGPEPAGGSRAAGSLRAAAGCWSR